MYGKIFTSIYDGTLAEDWRALITFQQMIVLCDSDGLLDMTPQAISKRTGIPIEHIKAGIEILENKDPYSRTDKEDGRRITRVDDHRPWGWYIVNHKYYRDLKTKQERRDYMREYMRNKRAQKELTETNKSLQNLTKLNVSNVAHTNTYAYTNNKEGKTNRFTPPSQKDIEIYCQSRNNNVDVNKFFNFYESKGWMVGKNKMKNWKAAIHTWENRENKTDKKIMDGVV